MFPNIHKIQQIICRLDVALNAQVNSILHHSAFQKLEASWRGLYVLVNEVEKYNAAGIYVKVLNVSFSELSKDLHRVSEFDQSQLFKLVYSEEFGSPGGTPYGLLVGDYEISHQMRHGCFYSDLSTLALISKVAAAAFSPFITMPSPALFGLDDFSTLEKMLDFDRSFQQEEYDRWKALRQTEEMRFVGLVLPKILQRLPYRENHMFMRACHFNFDEVIQEREDCLWGNSCYIFAANVARVFAHTGWFADIKGNAVKEGHGGGIVAHLPVYYGKADVQGMMPLFATEVCLTEHQEKILSDKGFIALCQLKYTSWQVFYSCPSLYAYKCYSFHDAKVNEKLSSQLNYVLCVSRFAQYVKVIARDKVGALMTAQVCEQLLEAWLKQYTAGGNDLSLALQAKYPLREARIEIKESIGNPGCFNCKIYLSPHYRFEQMETCLQLMTEIQA